ncbi:MAG: SHOCT domain-containing protein, partial [Syntrophothermus sp.]
VGEQRMHMALGYRYSGCPGGPAPGWLGPMAGMMGGGVGGSGGYRPGMMGEGEYGQRGDSPGTMMDGHGPGSERGDEDFSGPSAGAMVGMMAVLIGAAAIGVLLLARRRNTAPLETLKRRYANGELSDQQYEEAKRLLEGSR